MSVGSLTPLKNHAYLFKVLQEIDKQNVSVTLDLIGGGPLFSELQNMAQNLAIDEAISYKENRPTYLHFIKKAPCIYIVQHQKGLGLHKSKPWLPGCPLLP